MICGFAGICITDKHQLRNTLEPYGGYSIGGDILKTALITGANKGIGYETARRLATEGFQVFVGARNANAGRKAADAIAKKRGEGDLPPTRRSRWMGTGLLHLEDGTERGDLTARGGATKVRSELRLPRLGSH